MTAVDVKEGIEYGFVLLGYFVVVFLSGLVIAIFGMVILEPGMKAGGIGGGIIALIGAIIALLGMVMVYAGLFGVTYKIVADGVKRGIESSDGFGGKSGRRDRRTSKK